MSKIAECCPSKLPLVQSNYTTTGRYINIAGIKTYTTGFATSTRIVLLIYDIFGPSAQTLRGSDRLATSLFSTVLVPDLLRGNYAQKAWFDGEPSEEAKKHQKAFWELSEPTNMVKTVTELMKSYEAKEGKRDDGKAWEWAALGLCWGGKVIALASAGPNTPFKVSGQGHPSRLAREDAEAIMIPHIILAAPSDNKEGGVDAYSEVSKSNGRKWVVETYGEMFHGWMAARANLDDKDNAREFERAYEQIADFFKNTF